METDGDETDHKSSAAESQEESMLSFRGLGKGYRFFKDGHVKTLSTMLSHRRQGCVWSGPKCCHQWRKLKFIWLGFSLKIMVKYTLPIVLPCWTCWHLQPYCRVALCPGRVCQTWIMRRTKASMHEQATGVEQAKGKKSATKPCCRGHSSQRIIWQM